jgi:hypothetical protein
MATNPHQPPREVPPIEPSDFGGSGDVLLVGAHGEDSSSTGVNAYQVDNASLGSGAAYCFLGK